MVCCPRLGRRVSVVTTMVIALGGAWSHVSAQTVTDPRYVEFTASADHFALTSGSQPMVSGYQMGWYLSGATAPVSVTDLGKPDPDGTGTIRLDLFSILSATPTPGITYTARVAALGPLGSSSSSDSNPFVFGGPCTYTVSPTIASVVSAGSTLTDSVTVGSACAWSATSLASWISLNVAGGTGSGAVNLAVAANPNASARSGTVIVANNDVTISQAPALCTYAASPLSTSFASPGGSAAEQVSAPTPCGWTASASASWVALAATSGSGSQALSYTVAPNTTSFSRTATLNIAGNSVTITQAPGCTYALSLASDSFMYKAATHTTSLTTGAGCSWTAVSSNATWLKVSVASGSGAASVSYSVTNNNAAARTATITVGGRALSVTQASRR